jgi:hypothetical protein
MDGHPAQVSRDLRRAPINLTLINPYSVRYKQDSGSWLFGETKQAVSHLEVTILKRGEWPEYTGERRKCLKSAKYL